MNTYAIPMKLRRAKNDLDYALFAQQFSQAQQVFNAQAQKLKKARAITAIDYEDGGFIIILKSKDELSSPSKALAVFSQALADMPELKAYKDAQNHLLAGNGQPVLLEQEAPAAFSDSPRDILKLIIDIFMGGHVDDSVFVQNGRRQAQKEIVESCRRFAALRQTD